MKLISRLLLLLSLSFGLNGTAAASGDVFNKIIDKGEIRVGVSIMAPWVMKNKDGKYSGFEIDIANQLASDMGVKVAFSEYLWDDLLQALLDRKIDIIASGLSITPGRSLKVNFSQPYSTSGYSLVSNLKLTKDFKSIMDLNSDKVYIGAVAGTVSEGLVGKIFPKAKLDLFKNQEEAENAVVNGTVHAVVASDPIPTFIALNHSGEVDLPLEKPLMTTREAFAINKSNPEMLNYLNSWIIAHEADEWISSSHKYWFKSLKWRRKVLAQQQ
jgi:polar amino acid transport system substrate-binding protein